MISLLMLLEVLQVEVGYEGAQLSELLAHRVSALDHVVREHIFLSVDPEVIKAFLCTVENLRQVGGAGTMLFIHRAVEHLV